MPLLDLQASTSVGDNQILFLIEGPLNKLSYHLTSQSGQRQEDLIALLTVGETRSSLTDRASARRSPGRRSSAPSRW